VTGSTSGIGLGVARALAGAGAQIVLNGFGPRTASPPRARRSKANSALMQSISAPTCRGRLGSDITEPSGSVAQIAR
jgi:NAD(P)-dependent dehydrogenase (short-subunit alcohol dehydrogenase family)